MEYFTKTHSKAPGLRKSDVTAYRDYIIEHGPKVNVPDAPKNNKMAAKIRLAGTELFSDGDTKSALTHFQKSICFASNGSKNLAMGYANW